MPIDSALTRYNYMRPNSQTMFFVANENGSTTTATNKATFNAVNINTQSVWSNVENRFTAPYDGYYEFNLSLLSASADGIPFTIQFRKNGSAMTTGTFPRGYTARQYTANTASGILNLARNDYIEIWVTGGTMHTHHCFFSCKLVG
jgi:hypothetical protein